MTQIDFIIGNGASSVGGKLEKVSLAQKMESGKAVLNVWN
jgi:hypothetical protein